MSPFIPGVATKNPTNRHEPAFYNAVLFNCLVAILRTGRVKPAITVWEKVAENSVIKRQRLLINSNHF